MTVIVGADEPLAAPPASDADNSAQQAKLLDEKVAELDRLQQEITGLRTALRKPQSICVSVEVLEVNRSKLQELGVDISVPRPDDVAEFEASEFFRNGSAGGVLSGIGNGNVTAFLDALKRNNVAKVVANPCIVTMSGKATSLFVGEKILLPPQPGVVGAAGEYVEAGTRLDLMAKSLGNSRVRLYIHPRISAVGSTRATSDESAAAPSFDVLDCETTIETTLGEPVVLSGLTTKRVEARVRDGGRLEENVIEVAHYVVVRAEDPAQLAPQAAQVEAAAYEAPQR